MEYRIVFKTKHEEMHRKVKDFIDEMLQEYGVHPKFISSTKIRWRCASNRPSAAAEIWMT